MELWYKPPIYTASHIALGVFSFFIPSIIPVFIGYHLIQYFFDIRFFILEKEIRHGNSFMHTGLKIVEFLLGLLIAYAVYTWKR